MDLFSFLRNKLDILAVVGSYLSLKKIGNYYRGSCPFHRENDASFTISPHKQMFFCFGCKKSGDLIGFVADIEQINQFEAVLYLAEKNKIFIPEELALTKNFPEQTKNKNLYLSICKKISEWCVLELENNSFALNYLLSRGLKRETIKMFSVGFFSGDLRKKQLLIKAFNKDGILLSSLEEYGIFNQGVDKDVVSSFENRIIFPIKDQTGNVVGFGGRVFFPDDQRVKYYNSKEAELFSKKKLLFGINLAKQEMIRSKKVYIAEGYFDVLMMHQAGFFNSVATMGTSCSSEHIKFLEKVCNEMIVVYDSDIAGINATLKLAEVALSSNLQIKVAILPVNKKDPADFFQDESGLVKLKEVDIFEFFVENLGQGFFGLAEGEKLKRLEKIVLLIKQIPDPVRKQLLFQKLSFLTGLKLSVLLQSSKAALNLIKKDSLIKKNSVGEQGTFSHKFELSVEDGLFFANLVLIKRKNTCFIKPVLFPLFSENIFKYLLKIESFLNSEKVDVFEELIKSCDTEEEKSWLLQGFLKLDQDDIKIEPFSLLKNLLVEYTKKTFTKYGRLGDLKNNEVKRKEFELLLKEIKKINLFLNQGQSL